MPKKDDNLLIFNIDPNLRKYKNDIILRIEKYKNKKKKLLNGKRKLSKIANFHKYFGFQKSKTGWFYREWAPAADEVYLTGDFNNWNPTSHPLKRINEDTWEIFVKGIRSIPHNSRIKIIIVKNGKLNYKVPMFITKVNQEKYEDNHIDFYGIMNNPSRKYKFKNEFIIPRKFKPFIYEVHIGIAQEKNGIGSYKEFIDILPRIKNLGYNTIQIMAVASHSYYGSFGYHVTNFFAASHWFGDIEDLKLLIDEAHKLEIAVLMDIVHSHASKNINEGINYYDTTEYQLFYSGKRGEHSLWDSRIFDYSKINVLKFLLSNLKYYLEEYNFDGFRFDGVTSMMYLDHCIGRNFNSYDDYFSLNTDLDATTYLTLANELIKEMNSSYITIAEDVSGMPGLCLPIKDGGLGFDYRFNMGVSNFWKQSLYQDDHNWNMFKMWHELTSSRPEEKSISYAESHDESIVGNKTIMFKLADAEIYKNMNLHNQSFLIHRAISLHKLITSITLNTASDGYLNFIGNEFGHPEWLDFPSERNNWSYKYAKRQWHLVDDKNLKYQWLNEFNKESINFSKTHNLLSYRPRLIMIENEFKLVIFKRNNLYFIYNFHPTRSYEGLTIPIEEKSRFKVIFSSDDIKFGGMNRISKEYIYESFEIFGSDFDYQLKIYSPSRTMMILKKLD
ncbi:alpha-amylase family glycosyl hydrolase [Helcococcus ovis]|uniref:1,4-alpha-glucan branching enzyme n=1 Tax=Helcococcus ovis TaxID=72026 RepID=A0A4R9C280_9FIRM|nr:alpha-amylase family glycosyl hydrolase [Helcococcus ovis]TFF66026.1 1,4-alpha-glucan-branching enzyme [Helcococcus ovis]TFF66982.1 1,4-alpha-glucan-branching enzyme [Helcococcus ovis]